MSQPTENNAHQVWDIMTFYFSAERDLAYELIDVLSVTNKICREIALDGLEWLHPSRPWVGHSAYFGCLEVSSEIGRRAKALFDVIVEIIVLFGDYIKSVINEERSTRSIDSIRFAKVVKTYRVNTLETYVADAISELLTHRGGFGDECNPTQLTPQETFERLDGLCCKLRKIVAQLSEDFLRMLMVVGTSNKPGKVFEEQLHMAFQRSTIVGGRSS